MLQQNIQRWFKSLLLLPADKNASLLLWRIADLQQAVST